MSVKKEKVQGLAWLFAVFAFILATLNGLDGGLLTAFFPIITGIAFVLLGFLVDRISN